MKEKNKRFSQEDIYEMMPEMKPERQLPITKHIIKIPNAVLLSVEGKEELYKKLNLDTKKFYLLVIGVVLFLLSGFLMFTTGVYFLSNIDNTGTGGVIVTGLGIGILFSTWILGTYLIQVYCDQRKERNNLHKSEIYQVPVTPYLSIRDGDGKYKKVQYYVQVSGGKELLFSEQFLIPREQYQALEQFSFYAYYYEEKTKNDSKKYKVYIIGEKEGRK